jgi:hypothetical protein
MIKAHPTQNRMARQADPQTSAAALDGDQRYCRTAGRRILRRADSRLLLLADRAGQTWSLPATGLLGQVDLEGESRIGPAVDDGAEAAA